MSNLSLFPHLQGLQILAGTVDDQTLSLSLAPADRQACCPLCHQPARRVHSHYSRRVADLPVGGLRVCLRLRVRRFFCDTPDCTRRIFAEPFARLVAPFARRSDSLRRALEQIGFALGGRPGARLTSPLAMPASATTLLRLVRAAPEPIVTTPRVLGVDDWAIRKGHTYGTILIDLEGGRPVDLLPDRQAATFARWLQEHPGVEVISRDRAGAYAEGARQGAPDAVQVADRWHLLKNLGDGLERLLQRYHRTIQAAAAETMLPDRTAPSLPVPAPSATTVPNSPGAVPRPSSRSAAPPAPERSPTRKQLLHKHAHQLFREGCSQSAIASVLHVDRKTVRRYLRMETMPDREPRRQRGSRLDPYTAFIRQRWGEGCHNAQQIFRELQTRGYPGGRSLVKQWILSLRRSPHGPPPTAAQPPTAVLPKLSIRQVVWYFVRPPAELDEAEKRCLERLCQTSQALNSAYGLVQVFGKMVRERQMKLLTGWVQEARESGIAELGRFAAGLERDRAAVEAGLDLPWSNGPVEGAVNRLKTIKRQMYGRAGFDLLRRRVLHAV